MHPINHHGMVAIWVFPQHSDLLRPVEGPIHAAVIKQAATVVSGTTRWSWLLLYRLLSEFVIQPGCVTQVAFSLFIAIFFHLSTAQVDCRDQHIPVNAPLTCTVMMQFLHPSPFKKSAKFALSTCVVSLRLFISGRSVWMGGYHSRPFANKSQGFLYFMSLHVVVQEGGN